ncbi:MAG TPA: preprotein translocase subunit SecG [Dehalococcoidia bacterium]|nr:preprotein translocase subunit SecG [Dehalococcoidia bacterium]
MFLALSLFHTLNVAQLIVAIALSIVLLLQAKGSGFGAGLGGSTSVFRTRRGVEKTLFQLTIVLVIIFVFVSILSVRAAQG